jgi:hypothetical protein
MKFLGYEDTKQKTPEVVSERLKKYKEDIADIDADISKVQSKIEKGEELSASTSSKIANSLLTFGVEATDVGAQAYAKDFAKFSLSQDEKLTPELSDKIIQDIVLTGTGMGKGIGAGLIMNHPLSVILGYEGKVFTAKEEKIWNEAKERFNATRKQAMAIKFQNTPVLLEALKERKALLSSQIQKSENEATKGTLQKQVAPKVSVGDLVVGQQETTRPLTVSERKSQVSDFLTERFGAIDPTDPTGKKRIAVQGFDAFFQKAVPESEIKEFTTESGTRLIHINGKWEMMKSAEPKSMSDIRKDNIGVYGQQTKDGRLAPIEFIPNSGIEIGGLYRGTDAGAEKFNDEMTALVDARRSVKVLQGINDSVGEFADLTKQGIAEVEVMNLKAALRTDIIGVGTVSNFEQGLIDRVIRNPTDFFAMESKDRAILLALASRIDRRIQNIGAAKGLTVRIRDVNSANRYEALRQQYLKAKGIL